MAEWTWIESPGSSLNAQPKVRSARFGDGYEQRAPDGLNADLPTWPLQFNDVDDAIGSDMIDFLKSHRGVDSFDYTPLWSTDAVRVICRSWTRTLGSTVGTSTISATFEQVAGP